MRKPWNHNSSVTACTECDGAGQVHSHRQPSTWDPYPSEPCGSCDGEPHEPECAVCGYNLPVSGYDCLACETVASMFPAVLMKFDADVFAAAVRCAAAKARFEAVSKALAA